MEKTDRDVAAYIAGLPADVSDDIRTLDGAISEVMEGLPKVMYEGKLWGGSDQEIIGYGTYSYTRSDGTDVEWFAVGLAVQKQYISVYINAVEDGKYLSEMHGESLGKVKTGKSSISFGSVDDIDLGALRDLIVRARDLTAGSA